MKPPSFFSKWLPTPGSILFTLLIAALLLYAQRADALSGLSTPEAPSATSTTHLPYQGRLTDSNGNPINATQDMIFRLYNVASGGTALWTESWPSVAVSGGLFNVLLGSISPLTQTILSNNDSLWLGIKIGADTEMTPRVQLGSVPFAIQSLTVPDGSITDAKIANDADEPSRLQTWADDSEYVFDATGVGSTNIIEPGITITVPTGKAYYYAITYSGIFSYIYSDRTGSITAFYADWNATPLSNGVPLLPSNEVIRTGYRQDWAALGNLSYWVMAYDTSWLVRLTEGTYNLELQFQGYSDNTMNLARITTQRIQVLRIP